MKEQVSEEVKSFAKEQKTNMVCATCNQLIDKIDLPSYEEVFNDWHLMEWVAVGKYANHGVTIDKRNVL